MAVPQTCRLCGRVRDPDDPTALAWAQDRERDGRVRWLCPGCARRHARDIEARLDVDWW